MNKKNNNCGEKKIFNDINDIYREINIEIDGIDGIDGIERDKKNEKEIEKNRNVKDGTGEIIE